MGRSKVIVKHIDDPVKRKATFQKRKGGVMKKAMELSVLCGCDIAFVMFDEHGDLFQFASKDLKKTLKRAFNHKGKKELKDNDALLRTHGIKKERAEKSTEAPIGNRIDLTPAATCGLTLASESFGTLLNGVDEPARPISPPTFAPSSPERDTAWDAFDMPLDLEKGSIMDLPALDEEPAPGEEPSHVFPDKLPPRMQRSVDKIMTDITVGQQADDLASWGSLAAPAPHNRRPAAIW